MIRRVPRTLFALSLALVLAGSALADTIRLKDGQVIRGQIVSFRDQQFTVLIGSGAAGRRSRVTVYIDDVDSIEFDSAGQAADASPSNSGGDYNPPAETARTQPQPRPTPTPDQRQTQRPPTLGNDGGGTSNTGATNAGRANTGASSPSSAPQTSPASGGQSALTVSYVHRFGAGGGFQFGRLFGIGGGRIEGQANRSKMLKRQIYGRAKLDLLRARVLHSM